MSDLPTTPAVATLGHNLPPEGTEFEPINTRAGELVEATDRFLQQCPEIKDESTAERANDFIAQLRAHRQSADKARKTATQPYRDAVAAVNAKFTTVTDFLSTCETRCKDRLGKYLRAKAAREAEQRRRAEAEAQRAREEAEAKAEEAAFDTGSVQSELQAQHAQQAADAAEKAARRVATATATTTVASATGGTRATSLRTKHTVRVHDWDALYAHFRLHEKVRAVLEQLANAEVRGSQELKDGRRTLPGVTVIKEQVL